MQERRCKKSAHFQELLHQTKNGISISVGSHALAPNPRLQITVEGRAAQIRKVLLQTQIRELTTSETGSSRVDRARVSISASRRAEFLTELFERSEG
ncbi:hypothetical protein R1flu_015850 [Riccia fluitans]|uniref:Uncharacterized protein n=1 Tax=Riccia fluitans TaxID=41844 RepID=A0ABD1YNA5_9MARC